MYMGLYVKDDIEKSDLQQRIADSLRDKQKNTLDDDDRFKPKKPAKQADLDGAFLRGTKSTSPLTAVWIAILFATLGVSIWLIVISS